MRFSRDRRGQSVVIGTVILFGFLILALAAYQVQVVPTENANVEFEHSQQVENGFGELRNAILGAASTGSSRSTQIRLGTRYPSRTFFVNPPPVSGSLTTRETGEIRVQNATIGESAHQNVALFWNTDPTFETRSLRYDGSYNELRDPPRLTYEHSVVTAEFDRAVLLQSDQTIVSGDRLSLTALSGSVSENGADRRSVDVRPVSASDNTIPVTAENGPITLELPTAVDNVTALATRWEGRLPSGATAEADETNGVVRIMIPNRSDPYRLDLSGVSFDDTGETEPAYIVPIGPQNINTGDSVAVEVRDRYNNPVPDATVSFDNINRTTGDDGRASFEPTGSLNATINGTNGPEYESVEFEINETGSGVGEGGEANPTVNEIRFEGGEAVNRGWDLIFNNTGDTEQEITRFRLNFYNKPGGGGGGGGGGGSPNSGEVIDGAGNGVEFTVGGDRISLDSPVSLPAGQETTLQIRDFQSGQNDWFIVTIDYKDGTRAQYFVSG